MTPTVVGSGAGVAGSVIRSPSTAIRRAARCASNISRETPAARKRSSTVTTSAPRPTPAPRSPVLASGVGAGSRSATPAVSPATPTRSARHGLDRGDDHPKGDVISAKSCGLVTGRASTTSPRRASRQRPARAVERPYGLAHADPRRPTGGGRRPVVAVGVTIPSRTHLCSVCTDTDSARAASPVGTRRRDSGTNRA